MTLPFEPPPHTPERDEGLSGGSIATRIWDATKKLIMITDHLKTLEKEDGRLQIQVQELGRIVFDLVKEVRELSGQMKHIEKRFDDKDKMVELLIRSKLIEEMERVHSIAAVANSPDLPKKLVKNATRKTSHKS